MIVLWLILALAFADPQQSTPTPDEQAMMQRAQLDHERHRQAVVQLNELAGRIHSEADALAFVEGIADIFAGYLPAVWAGPSIRQRVAHAEYEAISDASRLIPEQRIADVWNEYVREIGGAICTRSAADADSVSLPHFPQCHSSPYSRLGLRHLLPPVF